VNSSVAPNTGIVPWWTYVRGHIPGVGSYAVNVKTGNFVVVAGDMVFPHRSLPLTFARAYNSFSQHDYAGTDGSTPSNYGNGWTNTYDAHIARDSSGGISVYDATGARHDFLGNDTEGYQSPVGDPTRLVYISASNSYDWAQRDGSYLAFYSPQLPSSTAGLDGRLGQIYGRNQNVQLTFTYSFDGGDESTATKLNTVKVATENGESATLAFADFNGFRLLSTLSRPDGQTTTYKYDNSADLVEVDEPGNNVATTLNQAYQYQGTHQLAGAISPRYYQVQNEGGYVSFPYYQNGSIIEVIYSGYINPSVPDGTNSGNIEPSMPGGVQDWRDVYLNYSSNTNTTTVTDSDGHKSVYYWDASNDRISRVDSYSSSSAFLTTQRTFNATNDVVSVIEPRGYGLNGTPNPYETDYQYFVDNLVAIAQPSVSTSAGTFRPTTLISYDSNENPTAICDPAWSHANGHDWTGTGPSSSGTLCPTSTSGTTRLTWTNPTYEAAGQLATVVSPTGVSQSLQYQTGPQQGTDYGAPTTITGTSISQSDPTYASITPQMTLTYDSLGNVACENNGLGTGIMQRDSVGRVITAGDGDDASVASAYCSKTPGIAGSTITKALSYYPNGQIKTSQTPAERAAGVSTSYTYDADGDTSTVTTHTGPGAETKSLYYDGGDRLIEVVEPHDAGDSSTNPFTHDAGDFFTNSFMRRYLYDQTKGGTVSIGNATGLKANGSQFAVQEYTMSSQQSGTAPTGSPSWITVKGQTYDILNRPTSAYDLGVGSSPTRTWTYDGSASTKGLLSTSTDSLGTQTAYAYDARGGITAMQYTDCTAAECAPTPSRTMTYDPDGRVATVVSGTYGTRSTTYDADGKPITVQEPSGGGLTSPATLTYGYYPNGWRKDLTVTPSSLGLGTIESDTYRPDGRRSQLQTALGGTRTFTYKNTPGGRLLERDDPYTGTTVSGVSPPYNSSYTFAGTKRTYDTYGRLATMMLPTGGAYTNISHDAEGNTSGYQAFYIPGANDVPRQVGYVVNARGELAGLHFGASYVQAVLEDSPLAYYRLNDSNSTALDSSGNNLNGAVGSSVTTGSSALLTGDTAKSMTTPGTKTTAGEVRVPETSKLQPSTAVSVEAWIKPSAIGGDIVDYGNDKSYEPYSIGVLTSGKIDGWVNTSTTGHIYVTGGPTLSVNTVYHVVMTYDGTTLKAYVNGALAASGSASGTIANYDTTNGLAIGGGYALDHPSSSGLVADVAVYGTALSADRVVTHYNAGVASATAFDDAWPHFTKKSANGVMQPMCDGAECAPSDSFDPVDGAVSGMTQTGSSRTYVRDTDGRQTNSALALGPKNGNYTRTFDGEHHLINHAFTTYDTPSLRPDCSGNYTDDGAYTGTMSYGWGPDGHVVKMAGETVHWDGNHVLFTSNSSGQVDDVKLQHTADINPQSSNQMIVWDRDFSGIAVTSHNSTGFAGWSPPDPYGQRCVAGAPPSSTAYGSSGSYIKVAKSAVDGITDGVTSSKANMSSTRSQVSGQRKMPTRVPLMTPRVRSSIRGTEITR